MEPIYPQGNQQVRTRMARTHSSRVKDNSRTRKLTLEVTCYTPVPGILRQPSDLGDCRYPRGYHAGHAEVGCYISPSDRMLLADRGLVIVILEHVNLITYDRSWFPSASICRYSRLVLVSLDKYKVIRRDHRTIGASLPHAQPKLFISPLHT